MVASVVELVNNALMELGEPNLITSLSDPTRPAILANQKYAGVRDATLRAYPWNCAITRKNLAPVSAAPVYEWSQAFNLPPDCLRVLGLELLSDEWTVEGRQILTNATSINMKYIKQVTDVTQFDALLCEALASRLAHALALPITQSNSVREAMWENYKAKLKEARSIDAQENASQRVEASEWLESRFGVAPVKDLRNPA